MGAGCELTPPPELMMTPTAHHHLMCSCACCRTQSTLSCAGSSTLPISIRFGFNWTHCFIGSHRCQVWVSLSSFNACCSYCPVPLITCCLPPLPQLTLLQLVQHGLLAPALTPALSHAQGCIGPVLLLWVDSEF